MCMTRRPGILTLTWHRVLRLKIYLSPRSVQFAGPAKIASRGNELLPRLRHIRKEMPFRRTIMDLRVYFENTKGHGVLATADEQGRVNMAIFPGHTSSKT